jgi:predicted dehydrogenase
MIHCAFIGFGKSATRYHLPYVLARKDKFNVKRIYDRRHNPAREQDAAYRDIAFTAQFDDILNDPDISLVTVCTHPDSHFDYARRCLEQGKNVLVEKPFTTTHEEAKTLFALAKAKGLLVTPFQNRRFDSCFLTMKQAIESGKLGKIVEVESHFDHFRPDVEFQPGCQSDGAFYGLGVHTLDQILSLFGRPQQVFYHLRHLRQPENPDDTFEAQLIYGDMKAIVKTSHLVKTPYPKFLVHGTRGSFVRYQIDQQEACLKNGVMPDDPHFVDHEELARLEYVDEQGVNHIEHLASVKGDYGRVYDAIYATLINGAPNYVSEEQALTNLEILEGAFCRPSPFLMDLA